MILKLQNCKFWLTSKSPFVINVFPFPNSGKFHPFSGMFFFTFKFSLVINFFHFQNPDSFRPVSKKLPKFQRHLSKVSSNQVRRKKGPFGKNRIFDVAMLFTDVYSLWYRIWFRFLMYWSNFQRRDTVKSFTETGQQKKRPFRQKSSKRTVSWINCV